MDERPVPPRTATPTGPAPASSGQSWIPVPESNPELPPDARKPRGTVGWDILFGLDIGVIAVTALMGIGLYLWFVMTGDPVVGGTSEIGTGLLWLTNVWNLVVFGVIPFLWVMGTRVDHWEGALRYLGLVRLGSSIGPGLGYAALLAGTAILLLIGLDAMGLSLEDTGMEARFVGMTWTLVVVTSAVAGFAEEVFFRGVLQKWIGVWGQALAFGLMHLAAGWTSFVITGLIGLLFGFLVKRGRSLWVVIIAHAAYDLILLSLFMFGVG